MAGETEAGKPENNSGQAKLIELVNEDLNSMYKFSHDSIDFRNPPKEKCSDLIYMTFRENPDFDTENIKHEAMKAFERDYIDMNIFNESGLFKKLTNKSIGKLKSLEKDKKKSLDLLCFKNFYNPFNEKFWEDGGWYKIVGGILGGGGIGFSIFGNTLYGIPVALMAWGGIEFSRKVSEKSIKNNIEDINKNIRFYNNFKRNIENSDISTVYVPEASEIYKSLKNIKNPKYIDFKKVNQDLKQAYGILE